jgi:hypothetical protein
VVVQNGREIQGMKCLNPFKHCHRGFESNYRHGSVRVRSMVVLSSVGSGLATGSHVQGVLPTVHKIHSSRLILMWKQARGPNT